MLPTARDNDAILSREKIELIKKTVAKGATDLELELFFHACKRTGLDPLMKQIYAIKRWDNKDKIEKLTFQTGIDGYRLIADRTGQYAGSSDAEYTLGEDGFPDVAKVTVTKLVGGIPCQFSSAARWKEYVQLSKEGHPTSMWKKMPFLMLAKCAEALALRKAFPAELSGVYTHEEMQQADDAVGVAPAQVQKAISSKLEAAKKISELRAEGLKTATPSHAIDDVQWQEFLDYIGDDPDRTNVGKQLKTVLAIGTVADLQGATRTNFIREFQESCKETGVPCEEWVKP
jgi:phage recombination protein Bet